ncbi:hypothetical protein RALTA_B1862 [Cupriavidus taiwanensis LMG 19424]|uniref:Uncharacterized protein n=1 Tax=Cupriavidus taiwanensis (strain DSM 17343 / BCRC 17206 / CCUG 44338 / CIP 107171 / LMG 19424 / R1) TaxID=977880 RepID=B3RC20_CUPTR|nr:hypothetical protein RALTA_B1862 [Cupriavidus taiwanensis LMG 19424]
MQRVRSSRDHVRRGHVVVLAAASGRIQWIQRVACDVRNTAARPQRDRSGSPGGSVL